MLERLRDAAQTALCNNDKAKKEAGKTYRRAGLSASSGGRCSRISHAEAIRGSAREHVSRLREKLRCGVPSFYDKSPGTAGRHAKGRLRLAAPWHARPCSCAIGDPFPRRTERKTANSARDGPYSFWPCKNLTYLGGDGIFFSGVGLLALLSLLSLRMFCVVGLVDATEASVESAGS